MPHFQENNEREILVERTTDANETKETVKERQDEKDEVLETDENVELSEGELNLQIQEWLLIIKKKKS